MSKRPNFLLIVADDLGYSDLGCFGGEIKTPNLDKLAAQGVRFSDYHTAAACSPTRSMIMSGTDNHIAGVGVMYEHRDPERWNKQGHEGYLNLDVAALPELLLDAGYWNVISGKWHLGYRKEFIPSSRGFHKEWALLPGCNNHFGWEPAWEAGESGWGVTGQLPLLYVEDGVRVMPETNHSNSPDGFYSSDFYVSKLIKFFENRSPSNKDKPFFAYLPFSAPHWPLQCYPHDRDAYKGVYDDGPELLRQHRVDGLIKAGLIRSDVVPHEVVAKTLEWGAMTPQERRMSARAMEVYAGMVTGMDRAIGRMIAYLEEIGELDNTVVLFQSDNGAEGQSLVRSDWTPAEAHPVMGPNLLATIDKYYDNSYDNLGNHNSYIWYGPRWAQAATAPNRMMKTFITEGGIRVPLIMRYPGFPNMEPGAVCRAFTTCMDVLPTFLELAGHKHPNPNPRPARALAPYRDRQVFGVRGKSWVNHLQTGRMDDPSGVYGNHRSAGWEQHGRVSLRQGKWKALHIPLGHPTGTGEWQLYDIEADQGETKDLASTYPDKLKALIQLWNIHQEETGTVFGPPIKGGPNPLLPDQRGGDPVEDQKAWMRLGVGTKLGVPLKS